MRLFIAISLPKEIKDYLWELKEEFRESGKINFTAKSRYHITLKFLGEVKEEKLEEIKEKLSKVKFNSFETSLNELGHFNNNILWINVKPNEEVLSLSKRIDEMVIEFPNPHDFSFHITLGRIKSLKNEKKFEEKLKIDIKKLKFKINSFELMRSNLSKDGPKYKVIEKFKI
jgi:2'-5' RNA ligase